MTAQNMLNALPAIAKLMDMNLPIDKAYKVFSLTKQINEKREFFINKEKKLIDAYQAEITPNGQLVFENQEKHQKFLIEYNELLNYEINDIEPLEISLKEVSNITISPREIAELDGVISFVD